MPRTAENVKENRMNLKELKEKNISELNDVAKDLKIEDRMVRLDTPLKEIGVFDVKVHLHAEVEVAVKVWVVHAKP